MEHSHEERCVIEFLSARIKFVSKSGIFVVYARVRQAQKNCIVADQSENGNLSLDSGGNR